MTNTDCNINYAPIDLGRAIMVVNPTAQNGKGSAAGKIAFNLFRQNYNQNMSLIYTQYDGHGKDIAQHSAGYDTLLAVGGDGLVHEIVNGLMCLDKEERPNFGVIPVGSGNDYARSLGISTDPETAINQIMDSEIEKVDVGVCNDRFFVETLSFGIDAGIAIDSMQLRKINGKSGAKLYFEAGVRRIIKLFYAFPFVMDIDDGEETIEESSYILAIQNGVTYGGGFMVTPDAKIDDGLLDICYTSGYFSRKRALVTFASMLKGKHTKLSSMKFRNAKKLHLSLGLEVPCQMDGEEYIAREFDISILKHELKVLRHI